jgi:hypothetical protein
VLSGSGAPWCLFIDQRINGRIDVRTLLPSAAGAIALAVFAGNAQAQCWWNGYDYSCAAPPVTYAEPAPPAAYYPPTDPSAYPTPYAAWNSWDYRDYRYQPGWLPSYPGPKPSSGTVGLR